MQMSTNARLIDKVLTKYRDTFFIVCKYSNIGLYFEKSIFTAEL